MSVREDDEGVTGELPPYRFYRGRIQKLFRGREGGIVRSSTGREIPFDFALVRVVGGEKRFSRLRKGMRVGFDVGWTSRGLRVTVLQIATERGGR
ncbi:MAG: hypothetical protein KatS3mg076_1210 [Candidatus Binatia bacterium]|nr:MAG: hypothetical protein KatS3mg076_1210 [Candidatus Binatia bacterium]